MHSLNRLIPIARCSLRSIRYLQLSRPLHRFLTVTRLPSVSLRSRVDIIDLKGNGTIKHVLLNRPDKLNAIDVDMFEAIVEAIRLLRVDKNVRVVIISGAGKAFCTGLDVKSIVKSGSLTGSIDHLLKRPQDGFEGCDKWTLGNLAQNVSYLWRQLPVPVITSMHGMCFGGGLQIALGTDIRFATRDSRMSIMEGKWGLIPDMGASIALRELVKIDVAKELTMTGRIISGEEAANLGIVTRCVDDPFAESMKIAEEITARSPDSVSAAKRLYQETWVSSERECLSKETELQTKLLGSWNQLIASGRNFGFGFPFIARGDR